ncbi:MAG: zinc-ribbon domain-containing protein, partial [Tannerellaceae bacterium]|nr:zinc-ribbon domain-containing protein [Tannerellaceae bacterium]
MEIVKICGVLLLRVELLVVVVHIVLEEEYKGGTVHKKNLMIEYSEIAREWNFVLNEKSPEDYSAHSDVYAWWICPKGHSYRARISNRTSKRHTGCPYCAGQKVLVGYNDLLSTFPQVADEWNYQKNNELLPQQITARSNKTVWWICKNGHEWQACINNRTTFGNK